VHAKYMWMEIGPSIGQKSSTSIKHHHKKYIAPLLRLARGALSMPLLVSMSETFSDPFYTLIKLCYTKALE